MKQLSGTEGMLDLMIRPAFSVKDGIITHTNAAAAGSMIAEGTPVAQLLDTGMEEYAALKDGCLYLTLCVQTHIFGASVTRMDGFDIFILEQDEDLHALRALALAARELRSPLADIMAGTDRLLPADNRHTRQVKRSLYRMLRLINNMSDASRYAEETVPRQDLHDVTALFDEVFEKVTALAERSGVTLRYTGLRERVISLADPEKLERAVYNLISNAMKFSRDGGVIDARLTRSGNQLRLTVCDSGCGIADELLGSVHWRYLRQPILEDGNYGIGLGMMLIRSAAIAHGGTVLLEQPEDEGTRVTMTMAIRKELSGNLQAPRLPIDYAGELDHGLIELADSLSDEEYKNL